MIDLGGDPRYCAIYNFERKNSPYILDRDTNLIGIVIPFDYRETDRTECMLNDIAQGKRTAGRVDGYTIFVVPKGSLRPSYQLDTEELRESLNGMADFFKKYFIDERPTKYERNMDGYYPGMPGTWHPLAPDEVDRKRAERSARMNERRRQRDNFNFATKDGRSSLTDAETGMAIEWENGNFNESQTVRTDNLIMSAIPDGDGLAGFVAKRIREMADFIVDNYPELI